MVRIKVASCSHQFLHFDVLQQRRKYVFYSLQSLVMQMIHRKINLIACTVERWSIKQSIDQSNNRPSDCLLRVSTDNLQLGTILDPIQPVAPSPHEGCFEQCFFRLWQNFPVRQNWSDRGTAVSSVKGKPQTPAVSSADSRKCSGQSTFNRLHQVFVFGFCTSQKMEFGAGTMDPYDVWFSYWKAIKQKNVRRVQQENMKIVKKKKGEFAFRKCTRLKHFSKCLMALRRLCGKPQVTQLTSTLSDEGSSPCCCSSSSWLMGSTRFPVAMVTSSSAFLLVKHSRVYLQSVSFLRTVSMSSWLIWLAA